MHYSELDKRVQETIVDILGPYGQQIDNIPAEIATYRYSLYIDGQRTILEDYGCAPGASDATFGGLPRAAVTSAWKNGQPPRVCTIRVGTTAPSNER